jgi:uncharacterized membrane protein YphA (DoxX/SURF4 family)
MEQLTKIGRLLYGLGLIAVGIHQLLLKDFRSEIFPRLPAWAHQYVVFPFLASIALIFAGIMISGVFTTRAVITKNICLYAGFCFLALIITCHLPYVLIFSADKAFRLDVWFDAGEELAYCGGAFVMAGSFAENNWSRNKKSLFLIRLEKLIPSGRIFFAILMLLFGCSHFVFTDFVATMVPKWIGAPLFWTYFAGAALIASSIAIIFKIWIKVVALLLAIMLFLFFIFFHIPDAVANPYTMHGNEIVRAMVALLFCGIALVIASTNDNKSLPYK